MSSSTYCLIFLGIILRNEAARILAVAPTPSLSHQMVFYPLVQELSKNHEVVFITTDPAFPKGRTPKNLTEIDIQDLSYRFWKKEFTLSEFGKDNFIYKGVKAIVEVTPRIFEEQLKSDAVQNLIKNEKPFDLILLQGWFRPALVWSHIYKVPIVKINSFGMAFDNAENMGAPNHPLLYPDIFHQRIYNLSYWETISELYKRYYVENVFESNEEKENEMLRRNFGPNVPDLKELKKNVHMLFLNVNPLWERNRPLPLNVAYIGRIHQKPERELPLDIKSFLDASTQGAIYMSFGTNVPPSQLPASTLKMFLRVISGLPYRVLWKWDADKMEGKPDNLMISKWFPQSDVFRHPNMKLVITQGGLQTTEEAVTCGLPLIGIPMLADQWLNVEHYIHYGIGVGLEMDNLNEEMFKNAIFGVINNGSYRHNVLRLRSIINDQPTTPLQRAILWIQYILKHGGTAHLRPAAANMRRRDYIEINLIVTILTIVLCIIVFIVYMLILIERYIRYLLHNILR